jgi:hypothetical protein
MDWLVDIARAIPKSPSCLHHITSHHQRTISPPPMEQTFAYKSIAELMYPEAYMLDFSMYQSGIDFKCPFLTVR